MADQNLAGGVNTEMRSVVDDFSVSEGSLDEPGVKLSRWSNTNWPKYLGYFKSIPEYRQGVLGLMVWTMGRGWTTLDSRHKAQLEGITGWGEDTFQSIMENMLMQKKVNGDAYSEIIRNDGGDLVNLKPLNPGRTTTVVNEQGLIEFYEYNEPNGKIRKIKTQDMLHFCNDRIGNEIHGSSTLESVQWVIDARNEAMADWRRIMHRATIRIVYIDMSDEDKLKEVRAQWALAIKYGEVMLVPGKKGEMEVQDYSAPPSQPFLDTIRYYEGFFYQALGVSKVITGGASEFTEAGSKMGYLTFEQPTAREQREFEGDLWNQLAMRITFTRPISLKGDVQEDEAANTGQVGIQPSETQTGVTRNE